MKRRRFIHSVAAMLMVIAALRLSAQQPPGFGTYGYDGAGNVTAAGNDAFVYDEFGRIRKASLLQGSTTHVQDFTYDRYGNIRAIATSGESTAIPAVDEATNRINLPTSTTNVFARYDAAGNLTRFNEVDHFQYDALNVMTESTVATERRIYLYNASNERIATLKVAGPAVVGSEWTLRDASAKVLRRLSKDAAGTWRWDEDYIYRGSQLLAAEVPGNTHHFHLDHLGTPRVITGDGGVRISAHTYSPFGRELTPPGSERMKFTGHERDAVNLDYMHARSYLPWTGRFLSVDPTWESAYLELPQSWNRYSYVMNNPMKYTDPTGMEMKCHTITNEDGTTEQICAEEIEVEAPDPQITPIQLGWEWLTGTGQRDRQFTDGDHMTEMLKQHSHVQNVAQEVCGGLRPEEGSARYNLSGLAGVPKYARDYSTLATGGLTGNLAVTYLGSYNLQYSMSNGGVNMTATNSSTAASGFRPPVIGYTDAWGKYVGGPMNRFFSSGPMSKTTQTFNFTVPCS